MKNTQQGFIGIALIIIFAIALGAGGTYYVTSKQGGDIKTDTSTSTAQTTNSSVQEVTSVNIKSPTVAPIVVDVKSDPVKATIGNPQDVDIEIVMEANRNNAGITAHMSDLRVYAEQVLNSNNQSYLNVCKNKVINTDIDYLNNIVVNILKNVIVPSNQNSAGVKCYSSKNAWAASIKLNPNGINRNTSYCVDSKGRAMVNEVANMNSLSCGK